MCHLTGFCRICVSTEERVGAMPSLIRQRREVLSQGGCLESIKLDDEKPNLELIIGSKTG